MPQNRIFSVVLFLSMIILVVGLLLMFQKTQRATGIAVLLLALTPVLYVSMLLGKRAFYEVSLADYHRLSQRTKSNKVFNTIVNEHLNQYQGRINGIDYAKLEYRWRKLSAQQSEVTAKTDSLDN